MDSVNYLLTFYFFDSHMAFVLIVVVIYHNYFLFILAQTELTDFLSSLFRFSGERWQAREFVMLCIKEYL